MKGVRIEKGLFEKRAAAKRKSRSADARALESGKKSRAQLRLENGLFSGVKGRLVLEKAKALCWRPSPLAFADVKPILVRLERIADSVVVVGGQAVNFWAELYAPRVPAIDREAPFTSKDIDFCGDVRAVRICAEQLGGTAKVATMDDHTPSTGVVTFLDAGCRADHRLPRRAAGPARRRGGTLPEILDAAGKSTGILFRICTPCRSWRVGSTTP